MIEIDTAARERGTKAFAITFTDEDDNAIDPETLVWTLVDSENTVINSREQETVTTPSSTETITLTGNDLQILSTESTKARVTRYLVLEATYNSDLGNGMTATEEVKFYVLNLHYISGTA